LQTPPLVALGPLFALFLGHPVDALDLRTEGVRPGLRVVAHLAVQPARFGREELAFAATASREPLVVNAGAVEQRAVAGRQAGHELLPQAVPGNDKSTSGSCCDDCRQGPLTHFRTSIRAVWP
jgi:hypothetical protein